GPVEILDVGIILRALIDVIDHQRDRRSGRDLRPGALVGEHARQDSHFIGLAPLRGETRLPRPALVQIGLDVAYIERNARRAAVDHAADRGPVALAERGDAEQMAERIERHGCARARVWYPAGPGGSNRGPATGSAVAAHAAVREAVDDPLHDVDRGCVGGWGDAEDADQRPRGAAVCDHDRVALERVVPFTHAQGDMSVAFAARRNEIPFVALARGKRLWRA